MTITSLHILKPNQREKHMNTKQLSIGITAAVILASSALVFAADAPKKPLGKLTCEDFIGIDDVIKPQSISMPKGHGFALTPYKGALGIINAIT